MQNCGYPEDQNYAVGDFDEHLLATLEEHEGSNVGHCGHLQIEVHELSRACAALRECAANLSEDVSCLRECLTVAGLLTQAQFDARLHRRKFEAMQQRHPSRPEAKIAEVLHPYGNSTNIGLYAGPNAVQALLCAGKSISRTVASILPSMKQSFPGYIYICGGIDGSEVLRSVECLNMVANSWHPVPPMLERRRRGAAATIAGRLHVCGGWDGSQALNSVERYDPACGTWESLPSMLECRDRAAVAVVGCRLFICGGEAADQVLASAECLDPNTGMWQALPPMLKRRSDAVAAVLGGRVYVCGGENAAHFMSSVERMCGTLEDMVGWEATAPMLERRAAAAAATIAGSLYVCGGWGGAQRLRSCERLDITEKEEAVWEALPPMSEVRVGAVAAPVAGKLYVFGGFGGGRCLSSGECFDPVDGVSWYASASMAESRAFAAAAAVAE